MEGTLQEMIGKRRTCVIVVWLMKVEKEQFLRLLGRVPMRLTSEQTAWVLNCQAHDIPTLVGARLLKPLGNPPANGIKFFATAEVLELAEDRSWLVRVSATITQHWQKQNAQRKKSCSFPSPVETSRAAL